MFLSRIDTSARHIIISGHFCLEKSFFKNVWTILRKCVMCMKHLTLNEDSNKIFWFWKIFFSRKIFLVAETEARLLSKSGNDWERVSEYLYYRGKSNQIVVGSRIYQSQVLEKKLAVADSSQVDRRHRCGLCRPGAGDGVHTVQPQSGLQAINQSQVVTHEKYDRSKWTQMDAAQRRGPTTSSSS